MAMWCRALVAVLSAVSVTPEVNAVWQRNGPILQQATGSQAALTEEGYQLVAQLKNDSEMKNFVKRVLAAEGYTVQSDNEDELGGFVPYYSGTNSSQTLRQMRQELSQASWVGHVNSAEVETAVGTLKGQKLSTFSNASAYAMVIANALSSGDQAAARVMIEEDLQRRPLSVAAQELIDAKESASRVVYQTRDGKVRVTDPADVAIALVRRPLEKWAETIELSEPATLGDK